MVVSAIAWELEEEPWKMIAGSRSSSNLVRRRVWGLMLLAVGGGSVGGCRWVG